MKQDTVGLTYRGKPRTCGFRLSWSDVVVLALGIVGGVVGWRVFGASGLVAPYVVGHFFLFCNVFRVRRKPELVWAFLFLLNCGAWAAFEAMNVWWTLGSQLIVTAAVIVHALRSPDYHGVLSRRINPRIDDYLEGKL